jgi:signal transduction histidine kinase
MKPFRSLFSSIVRSTTAVLLTILVAFLVYIDAVINPFRAKTWSSWVREPLDRPSEIAQCVAHPETWVWRQNGVVYAYHTQTGLSKNPAAPPLQRKLLEKADRSTEVHPMGVEVDPSTPEWTSWAIWRTGVDGDCGVLQYRLSVTREAENEAAVAFLGLVLGATVFAIMLIHAAVTHPIVKALHRLRQTAGGVGSDHFARFEPKREDEIGEVGRILETAHTQILDNQEQLVRARTALERFMADVAHDVRTPLAAMQLNLDALRGHPDPEVRGTVARSLGDIIYLASLTQNLRLAARMAGDGEPEGPPETFDLEAIVDHVAERQRPFAMLRSIRLEALTGGEPVWVTGNPTFTEQAITNIVQNAVSYGNEGGQVIVSLSCSDGRFELLVEDDGPGVKPDELLRLTERHFRADDARGRQKTGSGLGLSITQRVCDRMGWKLHLAHAEPSGLSIRIAGETVASVD